MGDRPYAVGRTGEVRPARLSFQRRVPPHRASITRFTKERVLAMRVADGHRDILSLCSSVAMSSAVGVRMDMATPKTTALRRADCLLIAKWKFQSAIGNQQFDQRLRTAD